MAVTLADVGLALRRGQVLADDGSLHSTVQAAENAASSFIWLPPETFNESVTIDTAGLVVMGSGRDTLIDGGTTGDAISIEAANVIVTNLSVQTTGGGGNSFDGIGTGTSGDSGIIERVWVRDSDDNGIHLEHGNDWVISNCIVESADRWGIIPNAVDRTVIVGCIVLTNVSNTGIFASADDCIVSSCISNGAGNHGILSGGSDNVIVGNRVIGAGNDGILANSSSADAIIANNNITGSANDDIDDNGTNTLIDANVPSVVLTVDDFESGNITSVTAPWNNWAGDTGSFSAQTGTVLAGSESGELAAANASVAVETDRNDETNTVTKVECLLQIDNQSANSADNVRVFLRDTNGNNIAAITFDGAGDIFDFGGSDRGDWAASTEYRVEFQNLDFDAETWDMEVIKTSDSSTVASATGLSMLTSGNILGRFRLANNSSGSGQTTNAYIDNIQTTR